MKQIQTDERDAALRDALRAALPDAPASPELRARVAQMATQGEAKVGAPQRKIRTRRARFAWSAVGVACALLAFAVALPRVLTTQAMAQIEAAMADVKSAHITVYVSENGVRALNTESWIEGDKTRTQDYERGITTLWVGGKRWVYNATSDEAKVSDEPPTPAQKPSAFTISALTQNMSVEGSKPEVSLLSDAQFEGRTVGRVQLVSRTSYQTTTLIFLFDKATDLPIRGDILVRNGYGQTMKGEMEFEFNAPLAPTLFAPKFGRDARFVELGQQREAIGDELKKVVAQQKVGERTLAIRDLRVNARGDVFALYTAGKTPDDRFSDGENWFNGRDWKVYLTDSLGTRYHYQRRFRYLSDHIEGEWPPRSLHDGQRLEGDWWVPDVAPSVGKSWQPRTFTLQFEVNPRNLHGKQGTKFPADYSATASFKIPVDAAQSALVPAPAKWIGSSLNEEEILRIEGEARGDLPPDVKPSPELERVLIEGEDISDLKFSPDGRQIATASAGDGGARLFDAASGRLQGGANSPRSGLASKVAFSPDGKTVGAAFGDAEFRLWDAATQKERANWTFDLNPDQTLANLAIAPANSTLRVVLRHVTKKHVDPDPRLGTVVDEMNVEVEERDLLTGKVIARRVLPHEGFVLEIEQAQSGGKWWIATLQETQTPRETLLTRWDAQTGARKFIEDVTDLDGRGLAMAAGRVAVCGQVRPRKSDRSVDFEAMPRGSEVRTYALDADRNLMNFPLTGSNFGPAIALSGDGRWIAFEDAGYTLSVRDAKSGRTRKTLTGHYAHITHLAFSPDGKRLVSADIKGKTLEWKLD